MESNVRSTIRQDIIINDKAKYKISKKILIAVEDTGVAYNFYKTYLESNYSIPNGILLGVGGASNFEAELVARSDYDSYIIVYDSGASERLINQVMHALKILQKTNKDSSIYVFSPLCFEEILLSFDKLGDYTKQNWYTDAHEIYNNLQKVMKGSYEANYFTYNSNIESAENRIQKSLEEITKNTSFMYRHGDRVKGKNTKRTGKSKGYMSDCWTTDCCLVDKSEGYNNEMIKAKRTCSPLNTVNYNNKTAFIADHSLLAGLTDILNTFVGINKKRLKNINKDKYEEIVIRLQ